MLSPRYVSPPLQAQTQKKARFEVKRAVCLIVCVCDSVNHDRPASWYLVRRLVVGRELAVQRLLRRVCMHVPTGIAGTMEARSVMLQIYNDGNGMTNGRCLHEDTWSRSPCAPGDARLGMRQIVNQLPPSPITARQGPATRGSRTPRQVPADTPAPRAENGSR